MTAMLVQSAAVHRPGTAPNAWQLTFSRRSQRRSPTMRDEDRRLRANRFIRLTAGTEDQQEYEDDAEGTS